MTAVGIEKLWVDPATMSVDMRALVRARSGDVEEVCDRMMIHERSVNPPWEDPVTLAVNACDALLDDEDRRAIKLLLVGTESGPDQEKSMSTWVQRWAGLGDDCMNLEIKHACYAGTGALRLACEWVKSQAPGVKALVVTSDQSRQHFHRPYEFVMGAGAVAMVVSREPRFLQIEPYSGLYTHEVSDLTRPTSRVEAGHSETSLLSYLDAVDITFERYLSAAPFDVTGSRSLQEKLPYQVYHAPFGGITMRAHRALWRTFEDFEPGACREDFARRVAPTLRYNQRMGGTYASSIFVSLVGCADAFGPEVSGRRVGIYSYGSGSTAQFFSGVFGEEAHAIARRNGLDTLLDRRFDGGVRGYEEAERERTAYIDVADWVTSRDGYDDLFADRYRGSARLVFAGVDDWERRYARA